MLEIILAGIIVLVIGTPIVNTFNKWKKEMDEEDENK